MSFVSQAVAGRMRSEFSQRMVSEVATDSRSLVPDSLYVPIKGERFDGHDFIEDAWRGGAAAALWARGSAMEADVGRPWIEVDDTRRALGSLAQAYRARFSAPVCAIGGANGKTTTKEMVAAALSARLEVVKSPASFNNDIGVPLSLLQLSQSTEFGVFEIGSNHPGEIRPLRDIVAPTIGIVTNIGREHLESFGDLEGVFAEESGILDALPEREGLALVDGDSPWASRLADVAPCRTLRVGHSGRDLDWRAVDVSISSDGMDFSVAHRDGAPQGRFHIQPLGRHQVTNALFAIALGFEFGVQESALIRALAACEPAPMRMRAREIDGVRFIEDCYNANPDSMLAALETLADMATKGRRLAILGGMAELGAATETGSLEVGRRAAELGVDQVIAIGEAARSIFEGARDAGAEGALWFGSVEEVAAWMGRTIQSGDTALIKGSRAARLERLLNPSKEDKST